MTKDEIKHLALNEFGIPLGAWDANAVPFTAAMLCRLFDKASASAVDAEREACAKLCEAQVRLAGDAVTFYVATGRCAAAIRERDAARGSANEKAAADGPFIDWKSLVSVARSA